MRVVYFNDADAATLTATSEYPTLPVSNLKSNLKSQVWRAAGSSVTLTAKWTNLVNMRCVALPFTNLTSTAKMQVSCFLNEADTTPFFTTGLVLCCGYSPLSHFSWGNAPLGVNAFSYGGGAYGVVWFPIKAARKIEVLISDPDNPMGYLEAGRLVVGNYWEPERNCDWGVMVGVQDNARHERNHGGDLFTESGARFRKVGFNLSAMSEGDRSSFMNYLRGVGMTGPALVSIFPESSDPTLEQTYMVYGKLSAPSGVAATFFNQYGAAVEIEEL